MIYVLFHGGGCPDGFGAAWAARSVLKDSAMYVPVMYHESVPRMEPDSIVYMVDFCYPPEVLREIATTAEKVIVLDHHVSAQKASFGLDVDYIILPDGTEAVVDRVDLPLTRDYSWSRAKHGGVMAYAGGGRTKPSYVYLHRHLLGVTDPSIHVDHVNRNTLDNRRTNLRTATKQQNAANMDRGSAWKGVRQSRDKWSAQITVAGKLLHLGVFDTQEDAARAYDSAAVEHFGVFARGNFIRAPEPPSLPPRNLRLHFDLDHSGAVLTWRHFHPADPVPLLLQYVEDRDLWMNKLPDTKEVAAYVRAMPRGFPAWDALSAEMDRWNETEITQPHKPMVLAAGRAILRAQDGEVAQAVSRARMAVLGGYRVPIVNSTVHGSDVGDALCRKFSEAPFAAYYFDTADGQRGWGLRSRNGFDVSTVAKKYGGGGHAAAAGFTTARTFYGEGEDVK